MSMTREADLLRRVAGACRVAAAPRHRRRRPDDLLKTPWDKVVEAAKAEGELTFYAWWGEEFWRTAAKDFEKPSTASRSTS